MLSTRSKVISSGIQFIGTPFDTENQQTYFSVIATRLPSSLVIKPREGELKRIGALDARVGPAGVSGCDSGFIQLIKAPEVAVACCCR